MSPNQLAIGITLVQAANRVVRPAAAGQIEATNPRHRLGSPGIELQGIPVVYGNIGP